MSVLSAVTSERLYGMAQTVIVKMTDDLDGADKATPADETVRFALDGKGYVIDLTTKHATELRKAHLSYK